MDFGAPRPYPAYLVEHSPDYTGFRAPTPTPADPVPDPAFVPASQLLETYAEEREVAHTDGETSPSPPAGRPWASGQLVFNSGSFESARSGFADYARQGETAAELRARVNRVILEDLEMDPRCPMMRVIGKGRHGGKQRRIPINPLAYIELVPFVTGRRGEEPVYPGTYHAIDHDWRRILARAGVSRIGLYALRRSFGRISHDAGVPIEEIQAIYGHSSPATTAYYIGVEETRMAAAMDRLVTVWNRPG